MNTRRKKTNRRRSIRRPTRRSTRIRCFRGHLGMGRNIARSVLDVSETGARLVVGVELSEDDEVEVNLEGLCH